MAVTITHLTCPLLSAGKMRSADCVAEGHVEAVVMNKKDFMDLDNPLLNFMLDYDAVAALTRVSMCLSARGSLLQGEAAAERAWTVLCWTLEPYSDAVPATRVSSSAIQSEAARGLLHAASLLVELGGGACLLAEAV